jgi:hypothetical protein
VDAIRMTLGKETARRQSYFNDLTINSLSRSKNKDEIRWSERKS